MTVIDLKNGNEIKPYVRYKIWSCENVTDNDVVREYAKEKGLTLLNGCSEEAFKEYNIKVEHILEELFNRGLISKSSREFKGKDGIKIFGKVFLVNHFYRLYKSIINIHKG